MTKQLKKACLLLGDFILLHFSLYLALVIRYQSFDIGLLWQEHWPSFLYIFFIWLVVFYINSLYDLNAINNHRRIYRLILNSALVAGALSALFFYLNTATAIAPKTNLALFIIIFLVLLIAWRHLFNWLVRNYLPKNNLALIGNDKAISSLVESLKNNPHWGYQAAIIIKDGESLPGLVKIVKEKNISDIVIADDLNAPDKLNQALFDCLPLKLNYFDFPDFYELLSGKIPLQNINQAWFIENLGTGNRKAFQIIKRLIDLIASLLGLIISLIVWPLIALLIKIDSRGPIFFYQKRLGQHGQIFTLLKFRSMKTKNNDFSPTSENDQRITGIGSILRKSRLDELPQLINIIKGEMSFIGPRPERPEIAQKLSQEIPFYRTRLLIKPGLTGWDQISGHYHSPSIEDSKEKLQYDLFYLKHRSLYLDLSIALKTLAIVMSRSGR